MNCPELRGPTQVRASRSAGRLPARLRLALASSLFFFASATATSQDASSGPPDAIVPYDFDKPEPLQFSEVETFVRALAAEDAAGRVIDDFWQPAISALVAGNPDKAELARSFGAEQRAVELAIYEPLLIETIDRHAIELLQPEVERQLTLLRRQRGAEAGNPTRSAGRQQAYIAEVGRIRTGAAGPINLKLQAIARLALTPDGIALRELNRKGLTICLRDRSGRSSDPGERAACAEIESSPVLKRLRSKRFGEDLIRLSAEAHRLLWAMISMGHAAGISLHNLLPPDKVRAAGLQVPQDLSLEELRRRSGPAVSRAHSPPILPEPAKPA